MYELIDELPWPALGSCKMINKSVAFSALNRLEVKPRSWTSLFKDHASAQMFERATHPRAAASARDASRPVLAAAAESTHVAAVHRIPHTWEPPCCMRREGGSTVRLPVLALAACFIVGD